MSTNPIDELEELTDLRLGDQASDEELLSLVRRLREDRNIWLAKEEEKKAKQREKNTKKKTALIEGMKSDVF